MNLKMMNTQSLRKVANRAKQLTSDTINEGARQVVKSANTTGEYLSSSIKTIKNNTIFTPNPIDNFVDFSLSQLSKKNEITKDVLDAYDRNYNKYSKKLQNLSIEKLYEQYAKEFNGYILYSIFGDLINSEISIFGENDKSNDKMDFRQVSNPEIVAKVVSLYSSLNLIKNHLEYLSINLPSYLNYIDKRWCVKNFLNSQNNAQILENSFDIFGRNINFVINNILKHIREQTILCSKIGQWLKSREKSFWKDIDVVDLIIPVRIISDWRNLSSKMLKFVESEYEKEIRDYGPSSLVRFKEFCSYFLPALIKDIIKINYQTLSSIISRDLKLIKITKTVDIEKIKINLTKRIFKLNALTEKVIDEKTNLKAKDVIIQIFKKSNNQIFQYLLPMEY